MPFCRQQLYELRHVGRPYIRSRIIYISFTSLIGKEENGARSVCKNAMVSLLEKGRKFLNPTMQAVILVNILPSKLTIGYKASMAHHVPLLMINNKEVHNILEVAEAVASEKEEGKAFLNFQFCNNICISLPIREGTEYTEVLRKKFNMNLPYSENVADRLAKLNKSF